MQECQKTDLWLLSYALRTLAHIVLTLLMLYEHNPKIDELVSIESVIPMDLDEWHLEINGKINEINDLLQGESNHE